MNYIQRNKDREPTYAKASEDDVECLHRSPLLILPGTCNEKEKPSYAKASEGEGGAAGGRTPVQTGNPYGFYMLILSSFFVNGLANGYLPDP